MRRRSYNTSAGGFRVISTALFLKHRPRKGRRVPKGAFTEMEALASLHYDAYRERLLSDRDYSRIWGRGRKWARARLVEFHSDPVYQGHHVGSHHGYQTGDQQGDHLSSEIPMASPALGDQVGDQRGSQAGDQQGATTLKQRQETETEREKSVASAPPLSALSGLLDLVKQERPNWTEPQRASWLKANLPAIADKVEASRPKNRQAAIRVMVRSFARAERDAPLAWNPESEPASEASDPSSGNSSRKLVLRRLASLGNKEPTEAQIIAHWRQFEEFGGLGPYIPPPSNEDRDGEAA